MCYALSDLCVLMWTGLEIGQHFIYLELEALYVYKFEVTLTFIFCFCSCLFGFVLVCVICNFCREAPCIGLCLLCNPSLTKIGNK